MNMRTAVLAAMLVVFGGAAAHAQSPAAEHIAKGDSAHAAMQPTTALEHYEAALKADSTNYEALWKASQEAVDLGEFAPTKDEQTRLYKLSEELARRAVAVNPADAEGHFNLARAIGRNALRMGSRDKIKFAKVVRNEALEALKYNPKHAGALHVMGMWNAEVMRLSGFSRMIARNFLGGQVFGQANWDNAQKYLEQAVAEEPGRLVHRLDLGKIYMDRKNKDKAREQFQEMLKLPDRDANDKYYKQDAEQQLKRLG